MADTNENVIVLPFDARGEIERMLSEIDTTSNPVGTAAQIMRLLMSWRPQNTAHTHTEDCMCVMVPMEVEGASECWYCGGHTGGPCGDRCDIARAEAVDDRASALPDPGMDVYDVAGPEPSADVLVLHDPAGVDINGGYLHRCAESGWSWSDSADTTPSPYFKQGLEWGVPGGSVRKRAQGPLVVVRRSTLGDEAVRRG